MLVKGATGHLRCQLIRGQVWKFISINMGFTWEFSSCIQISSFQVLNFKREIEMFEKKTTYSHTHAQTHIDMLVMLVVVGTVKFQDAVGQFDVRTIDK